MDAQRYFAKPTAKILIKIGALLINHEQPYLLKSGIWSPLWIRSQNLISTTHERKQIANFMSELIRLDIGLENVDFIAGAVTAGVPYAAMLADRLEVPLIYVREAQRTYGTMKQVEGMGFEGKKVLLFDDVSTTGNTNISFAEVVRSQGGIVTDAAVIACRITNAACFVRHKEAHLTLHDLCNINELMQEAKVSGMYTVAQIEAAEHALVDPHGWSREYLASIGMTKLASNG